MSTLAENTDYPSFRRDPESVRTEELASVIREWASEHEADDAMFDSPKSRDKRKWEKTGEGMGPRMGAVTYISEWSGVPDRRVRSILLGESKFTSLRIADAILTAIRQNGALVDGRVHVVPNPTWSPEKWSDWMASRGCVGIAA